jgi:hypothetical protein
MYRPQFVFPLSPSPCEDQRAQFSFDRTNLPAVATGTLAPGLRTGRIPLQMDKDADFYLRGITSEGGFSFRLEDPDRNPLSDSENAVESSNYELPAEYSVNTGAAIATLESGGPGVYAPANGRFYLYLYNATAGTLELPTFAINLHGVKRFTSPGCKG